MRSTKKLIISVLGLLVFAYSAKGQTVGGELYKQANVLLAKKNCESAQSAIKLYQRAKKSDPNLRVECDKRIQECMKIIKKGCQPPLELSASQIEIPYQGGDSQIGIISSKKWSIEGENKWCNTESSDKNTLIIQCREPNNSTRERITTLTVKSGSLFKSLRVVQAARPEYVEVGASNLSFPAKGNEEQIDVKSNAQWDVTSVPSWCKVEKSDSTLRVIVKPNELKIERIDDIVIITPSNKKQTIKIVQGAGDEKLTVSQDNLVLPALGGKHYMRVYTDAENWFVGDFPVWLNVQRVGNDSICIEAFRNEPNNQERTGSILIRTDRQTTGIAIRQLPLEPIDIIWNDKTVIGGRNLSFGVTAGYLFPSISASAGSEYVGSVVNYGLCTKDENASYKSATGFTAGVFADIRLYKNIFLTAGLNFTHYSYKNNFNQPSEIIDSRSDNTFLRGMAQNSFEEDYKMSMLEIPILASYRFKLKETSHLQLNLGPVISYGLSAKMKLRGNTDSENLSLINRLTGQEVESGFVRHYSYQGEMNLYKDEVEWEWSATTHNTNAFTSKQTFSASPLKRLNVGLQAGVAYEISGISIGLAYTLMLTNMANDSYWSSRRWVLGYQGDKVISGYKQHIHSLQIKLAYTLRY